MQKTTMWNMILEKAQAAQAAQAAKAAQIRAEQNAALGGRLANLLALTLDLVIEPPDDGQVTIGELTFSLGGELDHRLYAKWIHSPNADFSLTRWIRSWEDVGVLLQRIEEFQQSQRPGDDQDLPGDDKTGYWMVSNQQLPTWLNQGWMLVAFGTATEDSDGMSLVWKDGQQGALLPGGGEVALTYLAKKVASLTELVGQQNALIADAEATMDELDRDYGKAIALLTALYEAAVVIPGTGCTQISNSLFSEIITLLQQLDALPEWEDLDDDDPVTESESDEFGGPWGGDDE